MTPKLERARPLRAPRVVPDDIDLAFLRDHVDLVVKTASDCPNAAPAKQASAAPGPPARRGSFPLVATEDTQAP